MTAPTQPVTIKLADFGGPAVAGVTVTARMSDLDYTTDGTFVSSESVTAVTDATGTAVLNLFPNALPPSGLGTRGTTVRVTAQIPGSRRLDVQAAVPNQPSNLVDILVSDAGLALTEAQLLLQQIQQQAITATNKAAQATAARQSVLDIIQGVFDPGAPPTTRDDGTPVQIGDSAWFTDNLRRWYNGGTWQASDIDTANLAATSGSSLVGFQQAGTGAIPRTVQGKEREIVSVTDFYANGVAGAAVDMTGVTGSHLGVQAAATTLAANGGIAWIPPGTVKSDGQVTLPNYVTLHGAGMRATKIRQDGTGFAVKLGIGSVVRGLSVVGTANADGGLNVDTVGLGEIVDVEVTDFTKANAVAVQVNESYRIKLDYCYIYNSYYGIKFSGNVTSFKCLKTNLGQLQYRALDFSAGSAKSMELYFDTCYVEGSQGTNPIYFNGSGPVVFENCGFEDGPGSGANCIFIKYDNPAMLTLRSCKFSGFNSTTRAYTGTCYFIYAGSDVPRLVLDDVLIEQNYSMAAFTYRVLRTSNPGMVNLSNVRLKGTAIADDLEAQRILLAGMDVSFPPKTYNVSNVMALNTPVNFKKPSDRITALGNASTGTLWSKAFAGRSFWSGSVLRITAFGTRTGVANTKKVQLAITAGTTSTLDITNSVTTPTDWSATVTILFYNYQDQRIGVQSVDGATALGDYQQMTKDTATNDTTIALNAVCADAGDSITLIGLVLEWM